MTDEGLAQTGKGYRKGPVILRGEQIPAETTDQRLLDRQHDTEWVHSDPWRVMRIQSEFVEGFGALAEVGQAVSVFGSARTPVDHPDYEARRPGGSRARRPWLRGHHRWWSGHHGGCQQGCP